MTPAKQDLTSSRQEADPAPTPDGDRVVISGMSGLYPRSHNVKELSDILYNKVNPISSEDVRWTYNHPEAAQYAGKVPDLERFDAQFFKVHYRLAANMDAMARKILEQSYQAIYDAGVNPEHLSGKKVGVYIGTCFSETEKACFYLTSSRNGFGITGCNKSMFANRISYWLNAKGPSLSIDQACSSSTAALEQAYLAMSRGDCEAAIVGGAYLCLHPQASVHYGRIMTISTDGKTKSFDDKASGCTKSESINVLFLQKAKDALRIYADVLHVKCEFISTLKDSTGPRYGFCRDPMSTVNFLKRFYKEAMVSPESVEYIEAFGCAMPEADKAELVAIDKVFCKERNDPLLVGSVMSNVGYGEAASGITGITKVLLGYHKGELAANLHFDTPLQDVSALREGRLHVLTEHQRFRRTYTAVNGMSITGVNSHVLLHGRYKPKDLTHHKCNLPRLVTISGRHNSAVEKIIEDLKSRPIDPEELALLYNIHEMRISGHMSRGFVILDVNKDHETVSLHEEVDYYDDTKPPLWFVYSGMGSQWAGMGVQLMRIPIFAGAIQRCHLVLEPKGIDIVHIITSPDKAIFDNILHSFVGIAAIQIGLTDILRELGFIPDKIIGHSVGELGCAYADGCLTAEEFILSAYGRGLISIQTPFIRGSMAAVGIGYQEIFKTIPPEIEVACHNGPDSCTISGPADAVSQFVDQLIAKNIFAKEVPCSNIAYHSRYIAEAGPAFLKFLKGVIKTPKARSKKWVSTSVPQSRWNEPDAIYSSAEYHTNNLLNPVLFEETCQLVPPGAMMVEVAPHGLLQAILKRSLPPNCRNIPLTRRGHSDNAYMVIEAVGKIHMAGYNPRVKAIYPKVDFPVSTGTPFLSHLVEWAHAEKWSLPLYFSASRTVAASCTFVTSVHDVELKYLQGHVINGKTLYPFAAALVAAWDTLAMTLKVKRREVNVQFVDVHLYAQPVLHARRQLRLNVALHRGTGRFEITDEISKVATGFISTNLIGVKNTLIGKSNTSENLLDLHNKDVYELLNERGYSYSGEFRSIYSANISLTGANLLWHNNWVTLIDGMLQLNALRHPHDAVSVPSHIRRISIDILEHSKNIINQNGNEIFQADLFEVHDHTKCGGILIENIKFHDLPRQEERVELKTFGFVPHFQSDINVYNALEVYLQIVAENVNKEILNVMAVVTHETKMFVLNKMKRISYLNDIPGVKIQYRETHINAIMDNKDKDLLTDVDLVLVANLSTDNNMCQVLYRVLQRNTFIVNEKNVKSMCGTTFVHQPELYRVLSVLGGAEAYLELLRWRPIPVSPAAIALPVRTPSDLKILATARADLPPHSRMFILASYPPVTGLKDLVKLWRKDPIQNCIQLIMVNDNSQENKRSEDLSDVDLAFSVLDQGMWGGEYYMSTKDNLNMKQEVTLQSHKIGDFNSLHWVQAPEAIKPGVRVTVHYAGIYNGDVKRAAGVIPLQYNSCGYGMDFSGITESGERVMGILPNGAASTCVLAQPELLWPVPAHWSLEEAATVPLAYAHAYHCLTFRQISNSQVSVLVHGGAGALGQAVITIALALGYKVFATVSDIHKKRFLVKLFPDLKEDHIGSSRNISFGDMVLSATKGKGCNIVICCVKGELKNISFRCCAHMGIVYDTVQILNEENYSFGMNSLNLERCYYWVDFSSIFTKSNSEHRKRLQVLVSEGIARGYVRPLSRVTYAPHEAPRAFRLLAASRHRGRVLLRLRDSLPPAQPRLVCSSDHCHLLLCKNEAFAVQLADRLISRGAKKLYLNFSCPPPGLHFKIRFWKTMNVQVEVSPEYITDKLGLISLIDNAMRLGPVEGIYYIASSVGEESLIVSLDLASKNLCPDLKHFMVVSTDDFIGRRTCLVRAQDQLPATVLNLSALKNVKHIESGEELNRSAVEAVEQALLQPLSTQALLAQPQRAQRHPLLQQLAAAADIKILKDLSDSSTLNDLGIEDEKLQNVCAILRNTHNISLAEEDIPSLTIQRIKEMEETITETGFKNVDGLATFFSYVDPDELLATTDIVILSTLGNSATMRDDEFDVSQTYLCIIPGLEGHHGRFHVLCERLKLPALVLQPGLDNLHETPQEMAERYAKVILKKTGLKDNFYLMGYESGVAVALELAAILEEHGHTGTVFCVGYGPKEFQEALEKHLSKFESEEQLQDAIVRRMFTVMVDGNMEELEKKLGVASTWQQKVEICVRTLLGRVAHSAQYARALIEAAYARIQQARCYSASPRPLRSRIVLLRAATRSTPSASTLQALQLYSHKPIAVHQLSAPLAHAALDLRCASIVNQYLSKEILEAFENKNLCETYLLNADTFMTSA